MAAQEIDNPAAPAIAAFTTLLKEFLSQAEAAKPTSAIEPALRKSDFDDVSGRVSRTADDVSSPAAEGAASTINKGRQFAIIETAARNIFSQLIATTTIDSPDYVKVWNLLDILSILSDDGQCDPALLFWLAEELLDSQTIAGCRKIFDFLESRRERITANHFKQKQLIILRTCNELLRRLSRAEDTAFCGRVFIFMFQSFPLGDKSSVNLRGEYHVENATTYEATRAEDESKMAVDEPEEQLKEQAESRSTPKSSDAKKADKEEPLSTDELYPIFWSLQEYFSQPKKLFETTNLSSFKEGLAATMKVFQTVHNDSRRSLKRKRESGEEDESSNTFNPKYLTSKDLFDLEISDLSFRRHVLVQALIIMDFLISLSIQARVRLTEALPASASVNKAVMYSDQVLSDEDAEWASDMKKTIADYLRQGADGPYFYRMVETVLARDKNWVRWKIEGCHPIKRDPVSPASFLEAKANVQKMATSKRLRSVPMGSVSLDFLKEEDGEAAMSRLKTKERYELPELDTFKRKIADDDFEIDMPTNDQTKAAAIAGKASKSWRALRIAARSKLAALDKIEDPKKIDIVFEELTEVDDIEDTSEPTASEEDIPSNRDPIIICGITSVGKSTIIRKLMEERKGVFAPVVRHTTREPVEGEVNGKSFHFVKEQEFNQLRDGDRLIESGTRNGVDYGTSFKAIEAISESGKVPIIELDIEAAQYAKDMDFQARYVLVTTSNPELLKQRLKASGKEESAIQDILKKHSTELELHKVDELFDTSIVDDDDVEAVKAIGNYIYGESQGKQDFSEDTAMKDEEENTTKIAEAKEATMTDA
ncbi:related to nuclear matrix protein p84 [Fusarium fujikuroi]|uniref:Related to nuclear matrix protein p84 n=1 Tax=Gibberella fujikuroi (strain CBS 195.34 / IMI 58289 / NRRL A-6831) TaxID=1279085 RepID=S0E928_GIBF5|nr:related to nuclear matrix protein p84 [Fusarium fujikuroi IMI 58289]KLO88435.1 nuclear matrix protein p84 [Fusarium fujikuroi]KLP06930.1 nuclear matrix protein p84 [Fusarium fujikuroi]KLP13955.1 nuclear matrix protein p84 [Fusarium fujikuroi]CCT71379.1 related to nuclear matrix protein p84 [Fusarium fujikuroi IMI 58289]SCN94926.1 related to nuclear matrix protein p84 [Fusarium fujikuroi]